MTQHRTREEYAEALGFPETTPPRWVGGDLVKRYNIAPGSLVWVMHRLASIDAMETVTWGYRPDWAAERGLPMAINARIEKASTGAYFRHMWRAGRVIIPADGWYEWTGEKGRKQPWYIRLKSDQPLFMAAITNFRPHVVQTKPVGVVIVTAPAERGMIDVHDRMPLVLSPEDALQWMDNDFSPEQAEQMARTGCLPPEDFEWYRVSRAVNTPGYDDAHLIERDTGA